MRISDWSSDVCSSDLFKNMYARLPERRLGVAVLCNRGDWNAGDKADAVIEAIEGPILVEAARIDPVVTGRFFSSDLDAYYDLATRDEKLVATISSQLDCTAAAPADYEKQNDRAEEHTTAL